MRPNGLLPPERQLTRHRRLLNRRLSLLLSHRLTVIRPATATVGPTRIGLGRMRLRPERLPLGGLERLRLRRVRVPSAVAWSAGTAAAAGTASAAGTSAPAAVRCGHGPGRPGAGRRRTAAPAGHRKGSADGRRTRVRCPAYRRAAPGASRSSPRHRRRQHHRCRSAPSGTWHRTEADHHRPGLISEDLPQQPVDHVEASPG
jgi:hypothetical protein